MAKKISQLTQATQVKSDDVTVIVQDGETKKLPLNMMVTKQDIENKKVAGLAKLDEIEATYENDTYTPTIAVKNKSSVKVGEGDGVDYSANVMDGPAKSAILKGNTGYRDIDTGEFLETFEEGRNLELVSVKMPVLTTGTSRNMWSKANDSGETYAQYRRLSKLKIPVFEGETIYIRATGGPGYSGVVTYDENGEKIKDLLGIIGDVMDNTYIVEKGVKYIAPAPHQRYVFNENETIMYNRGSGYLPYEENVSGDYKTNILSCLEPVELGSVGEVKDELNLLTQQLTQRTETRPYQEGDELNSEFVTDMTNTRYKLAQEVVKTVDLTVVDQDNQPTKLGTFENITHVSLESAGLIPEVEMEVATRISKELASASPLMDDISNDQQQLETTVDEQTNNVDATMIATTEIYEETL